MADAIGSSNKLRNGAIALVAVLGLLAGVALVVWNARQEPTVESESGDRPTDQTGLGLGSRSNASARDVLTAETVGWQDLFGIRLPVHSAGPTQTAGDRASGFERSEAGAVLAGIHILYRVESGPGPRVFEPTIREQVVGVDKPKLLLNAQKNYEEAKVREQPGPQGEVLSRYREAQRVQTSIWAYRVDAYSPDAASIGVLLRTVNNGGPVYANFDVNVRWIEGDWRLVAPVNGELKTALHILEEIPAGFVVLGNGAA